MLKPCRLCERMRRSLPQSSDEGPRATIAHRAMHPLQDSSNKNGQRCCPFELADCSGENYILQCNTAIGVAGLLPFLGVSSLNFGPLARVAFFLRWRVVAKVTGGPQVDLLLTTLARSR
jgi:hypothetical protein